MGFVHAWPPKTVARCWPVVEHAVAVVCRPDQHTVSPCSLFSAVIDQSLPQSARLSDAADFRRVFDANDRRASTRCALVLSHPADAHRSRLGLVIAKKNVRLATERNRIKRLVREYFRQNPTSQPRDIVFLARRGLGDLSNTEIRQQLRILWRKLEKTNEQRPS